LVTFFAWGFLTEGWLIRKDFAASAALYRTSDLQMKYMPLGMASILVALLAAVVLYAGWCGGTSGAVKDCNSVCLWSVRPPASIQFPTL